MSATTIDYKALERQSHVPIFGDWHGQLSFMREALEAALLNVRKEIPTGTIYAIHVGDLSLGSFDVTGLEDLLTELDVILLLSDGNHDDQSWLASLTRDERGLGFITPHLAHVRRGTVLAIAGTNVAFMGGTSSINRSKLTPGYDWWREELITRSDLDHLQSEIDLRGHADVLITHDAPYDLKTIEKLVGINQGHYPESDVELSKEQRKLILEAVGISYAKHVVHGHWHLQYTEKHLAGFSVRGLADNWRSEYAFQNYIVLESQPSYTFGL